MFPGMQTMGAITNKLRYEDSSNINIDLKYLCGVTPSLFISKFTKAKSIQITNTKDLPFHTVGDQLSNITTFDWTIQNKLVSHLFLPLLSKMNNLESLNLEYHQNMGDIFSVLNTLEKLQFLTLKTAHIYTDFFPTLKRLRGLNIQETTFEGIMQVARFDSNLEHLSIFNMQERDCNILLDSISTPHLSHLYLFEMRSDSNDGGEPMRICVETQGSLQTLSIDADIFSYYCSRITNAPKMECLKLFHDLSEGESIPALFVHLTKFPNLGTLSLYWDIPVEQEITDQNLLRLKKLKTLKIRGSASCSTYERNDGKFVLQN